ncbi:HAD-IIIA family hydrolase [Dietzia kunjamensis]|uniref:HAD-IIIA family hydrolase n=1 Tax=Dietzia kunjamensis TaxID=322509 RepID=UPI0024BA149A|nr:HAD-IIIA family hydrolase [Dietzia kunjamensis]MDJ0422209.1 HAD-IIIA family hydrolase [Dietzia kunjamensis]
MSHAPRWAVVVPTIGRPCLQTMLDSLAAQRTDDSHPAPEEVVLVDDRPGTVEPLTASLPGVDWPLRVVRGYGRGPAAARNRGWQATHETDPTWISFLDDDVILPDGWLVGLVDDLTACGSDTGATQGSIRVPRPTGRPPTDWERNVAALEGADWATADMAYRRAALEQVAGFDERFPRAFREDADLALRVRRAGWSLIRGARHIIHPVRPADDRVSLRLQAGNADDALMRRLHGPRWREVAQAPGGGFGYHVATVSGALVAAGGVATAVAASAWARAAPAAGSSSGPVAGGATGTARVAGAVAGVGALAWAGLTARFLAIRLGPGPRPGHPEFRAEVRRMVPTSLTIPFAAVRHRIDGWRRHRDATPWPPTPRAVLFDRDGTLVRDVPYNGDPAEVALMPGAREAVDRARAAGLPVGVVSNQSGVARGLLDEAAVRAVNARVDELLGGMDTWRYCPHGPGDGCGCRKPEPGLITRAAADLGVDPRHCVVIGDIGADVEAALAAGARPVLVPTPVTRREEVRDAPRAVPDLVTAVDEVLH